MEFTEFLFEREKTKTEFALLWGIFETENRRFISI